MLRTSGWQVVAALVLASGAAADEERAASELTDASLKVLRDLKGLRELTLSQTHVTDTGLKERKGLTNLRTLELGGTKVTAAGLKEIKDRRLGVRA